MNVADVMTRAVTYVTEDTSLAEVARTMRKDHVGDVVVTRGAEPGNRPVGILTDRDIVIQVVAEDVPLSSLTAGDAMSRELVTVEETASVVAAVSQMGQHGIRRLPVTDREGQLIGLLSMDDVLAQLGVLLDNIADVVRFQQQIEEEIHS
jgi:CBS domain-containing protein